MGKTQVQEIKGRFEPEEPEAIMPQVTPYFVRGEDAESAYQAVGDFGSVWYAKSTKTMKGSNLPISARMDSIVRPLGLRVVNLRDLSRPEVMQAVKGRYYVDTPALVGRSRDDTYDSNKILIEQVLPLVEQKAGKVEFPFLITGFDVKKTEDGRGYGWTIVPRDDFNVVSDERLAGKYHGKRFDSVDEIGLPNFDDNGKRTWSARDKGLSRLCMDGGLDLGSGNVDLSDSNDYGRVVLVRDAVADAKKIK